MLRAISSFKPQRILLAYTVVSTAVVLVPIYYFWEECRIDDEFAGVSTRYFCGSGFVSVLAGTFFNPLGLILYAPIIGGGILAALRNVRQKMSALRVEAVVSVLTVLTVWSTILIAFVAWFAYGDNQFYRNKQCYITNQYAESIPCLKGAARANLSNILAPIEIVLCVTSITLALMYRFYY